MITNWYFTGDCHGNFSRFKGLDPELRHDSHAGIIILGDAGFNFWLDEKDIPSKNEVAKLFAFTIYCVKGNHEVRPENVPDMIREYDLNVGGYVWYQVRWPNIRYFDNFGIYSIYSGDCRYTLGVVGGAYSVDKYHRILKGTPWFSDEQLDEEEKKECLKLFTGRYIDIMLTHTCPVSLEPRDLFLPFINQDLVDKGMEIFLEELSETVHWKLWVFGHYHDDRVINPQVRMMYRNINSLEDILENKL